MEYITILLLLVAAAYFVLRGRKSGIQAVPTDMLPDTFIVFDLETTGLKAESNEIIEVAAIRFKKGTNTHDTYQSLVKPKKAVPKKITEITGITQAMVDDEGRSIDEVLEEFRSFVGELRLVTFNAEFDMAFIQTAAARAGKRPFDNPVSCALKMARRAWPQRKSFRLDDLANDGSINEGQAHRALEDARRALIIYAAAAAQLKSIA
jgi:DNA polymerase III epsilon subunit family exonuclease